MGTMQQALTDSPRDHFISFSRSRVRADASEADRLLDEIDMLLQDSRDTPLVPRTVLRRRTAGYASRGASINGASEHEIGQLPTHVISAGEAAAIPADLQDCVICMEE